MTTLNLQVDEYTNRVLGVIKEAFGLRDKSEALRKFTQLYGSEFIHEQVSHEVAMELKALSDEHSKKYGFRKMSLKELDKRTGVR
jgi:endonuclease III-like uncharacterized protein